MTLRDAHTGMCLKIKAIHDFPLKERLMTMGMLPGTKIKVLRSAPLGDPMMLLVRSYNLAVRRKDAEHIEVVEDKEAEYDTKIACSYR